MNRKQLEAFLVETKLPITGIFALVGFCGVLKAPNITKSRVLKNWRHVTHIKKTEKSCVIYFDGAEKIKVSWV